MNEIMSINGVECYEKDGVAYLKLEAVARGLGFTEIKDDKEYVMWRRVDGHLANLGFGTSAERPDFIPENIFYRLAMKAKNEVAEAFQAKVADEIIPAIRRHGGYLTQEKIEEAILNPDVLIRLATELKNEREARRAVEAQNAQLTADNQKMLPKAEYFDELVERNLLTSFRTTAKELKIKEQTFINFLMARKFIYRDKSGKLRPYAQKNDGLFELKECVNDKAGWAGVQTLVTPKGRETFRLLMQAEERREETR